MPRPSKPKPLHLRLWHRRIGSMAALFAILLGVTGLLLNHTGDLHLDSRYVKSHFILNWYGVTAPQALSYAVAGHWISQLGRQLYYDTAEIPDTDTGTLVGAVKLADLLVVAIEGHLIVLDARGKLVDTLSGVDGVPSGMSGIGVVQGRLAVRASHADYVTDEDMLRWEESEKDGVDTRIDGAIWAKPSALPGKVYEQLAEHYRGKGLPVERLVQDLHSGRILGKPGVFFIDAMALLFIFLAGSGLWMWLRHYRRK